MNYIQYKYNYHQVSYNYNYSNKKDASRFQEDKGGQGRQISYEPQEQAHLKESLRMEGQIQCLAHEEHQQEC